MIETREIVEETYNWGTLGQAKLELRLKLDAIGSALEYYNYTREHTLLGAPAPVAVPVEVTPQFTQIAPEAVSSSV